MRREELLAILESEGVNPNAYSLDGGHPSERLVLAHSANGWVVYYSERGLESGWQFYATESEACEHLLNGLRRDASVYMHLVVGPLPPDEADEAFRLWCRARLIDQLEPPDMRVDNPALASGPQRRYWVHGRILRHSIKRDGTP